MRGGRVRLAASDAAARVMPAASAISDRSAPARTAPTIDRSRSSSLSRSRRRASRCLSAASIARDKRRESLRLVGRVVLHAGNGIAARRPEGPTSREMTGPTHNRRTSGTRRARRPATGGRAHAARRRVRRETRQVLSSITCSPRSHRADAPQRVSGGGGSLGIRCRHMLRPFDAPRQEPNVGPDDRGDPFGTARCRDLIARPWRPIRAPDAGLPDHRSTLHRAVLRGVAVAGLARARRGGRHRHRPGGRRARRRRLRHPVQVLRPRRTRSTASDIDSFFTASGKAAVHQPADRLHHRPVEQERRGGARGPADPGRSACGVADLAESPIDWAASPRATPEAIALHRSQHDLRPHQVAALDDVVAGFATADRGKLDHGLRHRQDLHLAADRRADRRRRCGGRGAVPGAVASRCCRRPCASGRLRRPSCRSARSRSAPTPRSAASARRRGHLRPRPRPARHHRRRRASPSALVADGTRQPAR